MSGVLKKIRDRDIGLQCRDLLSGATASVRARHKVLGGDRLDTDSFLSLVNSDLQIQLFCCPSSPSGKVRSVKRGEGAGIVSELREWLVDGSEFNEDSDFAFNDVIPVFAFDEAADVLFTVASGEFRDKLLLWDHEVGAPGEEVIATDLGAFVGRILEDPIPLLESDVRFAYADVLDGTVSEDAQLVAVGIEDEKRPDPR